MVKTSLVIRLRSGYKCANGALTKIFTTLTVDLQGLGGNCLWQLAYLSKEGAFHAP
jgi:hypothetical protein